MYALLGKYHELWTFRPVFFIHVIGTTSPHSIIFHYHLIFIFLYFHHYLFHYSFSLLGVMIFRIFKPVFFIPVIVTTSPYSIIFHYHLIFIFLYFHHYLFHSSFSLLRVMILRIFWYIKDSHITPFFIPSFDIDSEILA